MLDPKLLREHPELVKDACRRKNSKVDVDLMLELDAERRSLQAALEQLNQERNQASQAKDIEKGREVKLKIGAAEAKLKELDERLQPLLLQLPNIPSADTPDGPDDSANVVLRKVGEPRQFSFPVKDHVELGEQHGFLNAEKGAEVAGARFTYLMGDLVLLQYALLQYALSILTSADALATIAKDAGLDVPNTPFVPVAPPIMIRPEVFQKMARLEPRDERYHIESDDLYLIGSAEHTLGPLHMGETIPESQMPKRYAAFTPAFRREAGSYGKDTRGILRQHQFDKLEMESFTVPEASLDEQNFLVAIQEHILKALELPYQVVMTCTGDQGDPDARHLDVECWMPGQDKYRETHSADLMTDYQTRRLGTRVKREGGKSEYAHTNDATCVAMGRTLIALLENHQQEDGSIAVPDVLRPFMGGKAAIGASRP